MDIEEFKDRTLITFGDAINLNNVESIYPKLVQVLKQGKFVVFNAQAVETVDASGIQLLVAYCVAAEKLDLTWAWQNPSTTLISFVNLLGCEIALHLKGDV